MDGFLVLARCGTDDIPMALCPTQCAAAAKAEELATLLEVNDVARGVLNVDVGTLICMTVVEFQDGEPVDAETINMPDDDDD